MTTKIAMNDEEEYDWIRTLGAGGFATVELVSLKGRNELFAMKRFKHGALDSEEAIKQMEVEVENLKTCSDSLFVVKYYGSFISTLSTCLLLEPCLGGDLWWAIKTNGPFSDGTAKFYCACVIEGLKYLESRGIFYRDLKPENLLLDEAGYLKIADLGFSKPLDKDEKTFTVVGTAEYLSPEMLSIQGYSFSATLWSLGILIYEMLTGTPPFVADDQKTLFKKICVGFTKFRFPSFLSSNAVEVILMLCRKNPSHRPGLGVVTRYMWFAGFNWDALRKGTLPAPCLPLKSHKVIFDQILEHF